MLDVLVDKSIYSDEELRAILLGIKRKKKFIKIGDSFINISSENTRTFYELAKDFDLISNGSLSNRTTLPLYYAFKVSWKTMI